MLSPSPVFAYFSPETFLPLTSVLASAAGVFLLFGRGLIRIARRSIRITAARLGKTDSIPRPHFPAQARSQAEVPPR